MPLHLITGPANAGKAKLVLDSVRSRADDGPLLVVPTLFDVHAYQQELAAGEAVFGPRVLRFEWLVEELARRTGTFAPRLGDAQRDALLAAAVRRAEPRALAVPAATPGFTRALGALVDELGRALVAPELLGEALHEWARTGGTRRAYARDVAALYAAWHDLLRESGLVDEPLLARRAIEALAAQPDAWGRAPVFVYGFDDLTELQLETIRALVAAGAEVTVALTWEDRLALETRRSAVDALRSLADRFEELAPHGEQYATAPLHHLERSLFADGVAQVDSDGSVALLRAGGERAELELIAVEALELLERGFAPEEIAIVFRRPEAVAPLAASVLEAYGVPYALDQRLPLGHTALGGALLAGFRAALLGGDAGDLLAWLRSPGWLRQPGLADQLELAVRQDALDLAGGREAWEAANASLPLDALDGMREAGQAGPDELLRAVGRELRRLFKAAHAMRGSVLRPEELEDVASYRAALEALEGLAVLRETVPGTLEPAALHETLSELEIRVGAPASAPGVRLLGPLALRARRFRALILGGLQEGEFPQTSRPEPFLSDAVRRELRDLAGIPLRLREDAVADERALLYGVVSRPTERLVLSYRFSDEEGQPAVRSLFVDDVQDCFETLPERERGVGEILWAEPPTPREAARLDAARRKAPPPPIGPLTDPLVLEQLAGTAVLSAGQLETWNACPVRWLMERFVKPAALEPEPEARAKGTATHELLEHTLRTLGQETGSARVTMASLERAEALLEAAVDARRDELLALVRPGRRRAEVRRLQSDLRRYLRRLAELDIPMIPTHFELQFGFDAEQPVDLGDGLALRGVIDRIDVSDDGSQAAVIDYKGSTVPTLAEWQSDGKLQVALYMLVAERILETKVVAGVYQPLGRDLRARGAILEGSLADIAAVKTDRCDEDELEGELRTARECAVRAANELREGALESRPARCHWREADTCSHPGICRAVAS